MKNKFGSGVKISIFCVGSIVLLLLCGFAGTGVFLEPSFAQAASPAITQTKDNPGIRKAIEVQNRYMARLKDIPGVVGFGTGMGPGGHPVIRVFTRRAGLPGVPKSLDAIPVHEKVTGEFIAFADPAARFSRPVPIGVSTGHPDITAGTIGARVIDAAGDVYALSNNHVYANINNALIGDNALQPGPYDGGIDPDDKIGELCDYQPIDFSVFGSNTIDAAIVCTTPGEVANATLPEGYGVPGATIFNDADTNGFFDNLNALLLQPVQKFGRTTSLTHGQITEINVTVTVCYANCSNPLYAEYAWFDDQIAIGSVNSGAFSLGGDSGSLIVTDDSNKNPVGLLFAGSSTTTLANRIDLVLNRFNVFVDGGPTTPTENDPPSADFSFAAAGLDVSFTDLSADPDGDVVAWAWDFGDGNGSSDQHPVHTYAVGGTYTTTLTVTDDQGATGQVSKAVTVSSPGNAITLTATGYKVKGRQKADLAWSGATTADVDVYRDGSVIATVQNSGSYTDNIDHRGGNAVYTYKVCEAGTATCSNEAVVAF